MEKVKISEILKNQTITNQFDFSGSCPDKEGVTVTFSIFTTAFFMMEVTHNYFNRSAFVDPDNAFTDFLNIFTQWKNTRGYMYARMAYAYSLGYNPIENYSSLEKHTGHDDYENHKKITRTWTADKIEREYTNLASVTSHDNDKATTTYNALTDTDKNYKFGVNSSNKVQQNESENTRSGSESVEYTGTKTDTTNGKYSDTHSGSYNDENSGTDKQIYNSEITKSGNIGIQTASEMIQKLYEGLAQDLANRALKEFLERYTFYSEGVDLW